MGFWDDMKREAEKSVEDAKKKTLFDTISTQLNASVEKTDPALQLSNPVAGYREDQKRKKGIKADEDANTAEAAKNAAPGIELNRRNAIPLLRDDSSIEAAKRRALVNQQKRSGRESTMLSVGLGK